jgi:hypothetical protein
MLSELHYYSIGPSSNSILLHTSFDVTKQTVPDRQNAAGRQDHHIFAHELNSWVNTKHDLLLINKSCEPEMDSKIGRCYTPLKL